MTEHEQFEEWFQLAPHRRKYTPDHPAYLAAKEAWEARAASQPAKEPNWQLVPPPLKYVTHSQQNSPAKRRHLEAYAKAAVRDALERAAQLCEGKQSEEIMTGKVDHNELPWTWVCCNAIRAMLKEYSDD